MAQSWPAGRANGPVIAPELFEICSLPPNHVHSDKTL